MWASTILIGLIVVLFIKYYTDRRKKQRVFQDQGVPGIPPHFIFGNFGDYKGQASKLLEWRKKFGRTFYMYDGARPNLVTSDLEIIKQVGIKDFSTFHSREMSIFFKTDDSMMHAQGKVWKRLRMIVSPTFSARRMKAMSPLVNKCVGSFMDVLAKREDKGEPFNISTDFQGLTMTVIANCGFGLDLNALRDPENIFLRKCKAVFNLSGTKRPFYYPLIVIVGFLFPRVAPVLHYVFPGPYQEISAWFHSTAAAIIKDRKESGDKRMDFIQLMLDAEADTEHATANTAELEVSVNEDEDLGDHDDTTNGSTTPTSLKKPAHTVSATKSHNKTMTLREMQSNCMTFLLAGYETTSTALSFAAYELALNPQVQEKLQFEIDEHFPDDADNAQLPDYLSVQKMPYLDMFFSEVLRLHSIAGVVTLRGCYEDTHVNGLFIPKGSVVRIHMEAVHKDPEYWGPEDPEDFIPDRFLPDRKATRNSLAWQPFGVGPRNCVGMRFAIMEAKITLTRLLKKFTICRTEETVVPVKVAEAGVRRPVDGIVVRLERRS